MIELKIADLLDSFRSLLHQLDDSNFIEYGVPGDSFMSYLRIRRVSVFAEVQYSIHILHLGREGSGMYYALADEQRLANDTMRLVLHYHRPLFKVSRELQGRIDAQKRKSELQFFLRKELKARSQSSLQVEVVAEKQV